MIWDEFVPKFTAVTGCPPFSDLVKPSGPRDAILGIQWHYPTYTTRHREFGMTFDPSNSCLNQQKFKIGCSGSVFTIDNFPVRKDSKK
jgi:hypothetical protein